MPDDLHLRLSRFAAANDLHPGCVSTAPLGVLCPEVQAEFLENFPTHVMPMWVGGVFRAVDHNVSAEFWRQKWIPGLKRNLATWLRTGSPIHWEQLHWEQRHVRCVYGALDPLREFSLPEPQVAILDAIKPQYADTEAPNWELLLAHAEALEAAPAEIGQRGYRNPRVTIIHALRGFTEAASPCTASVLPSAVAYDTAATASELLRHRFVDYKSVRTAVWERIASGWLACIAGEPLQ